jgi:hypothetical protein
LYGTAIRCRIVASAPAQQVVLGAVIIPPAGTAREYGIQFVGYDPYPREDVKTWFAVVKAAVIANPNATAVYIPSFEQKDSSGS